MKLLRLSLLAAACVGLLAPSLPAVAAPVRVLKISHQFPPGTDFRDKLAHKFADEVARRTHGQLKVEVYPANSLFKTMSQFDAMRKGALDMSVLPLAYAGGEVPEVNITLMPTLVTSYEQGLRWKNAAIGKELDKVLDAKGVKILTWIWQAGGIASKSRPVLVPGDVRGMKIRGGDRSVDLLLHAAGGAITNVPSNEIYNAMQSGVLDGAVTSSTSLLSYRLYEQSKDVTTARKRTFWFMLEPLLIAKSTFDSLTPQQQKIVMDVGASLEKEAMADAKADDQRLAKVYAQHGVKVLDMNDAAFNQWRAIAQKTSWADYANRVKNGKHLIDLAASVK